MAAVPAFLDTCAIYGGYLCDTLLRLAEAGTYRPLWSADVLEELSRNLTGKAGVAAEDTAYRINQMRTSFPGAELLGYESLAESMTCDLKDRHVLAAAVRGGAEIMVTFNVTDFPAESADPYAIAVLTPDDFLLDQLDLYPGATLAALRAQAASYKSPAMSVEDLLGRLAASGATRFASEARRHLS